LIAGLVVAGFGLAPVYLSPVSNYLLGHYQVKTTMLMLGIAFTVIVCGLAQLLRNPPAGHVAGSQPVAADVASQPTPTGRTPGEILRTPGFYLLWVIYFVGAGAGLMVIGSVSGMAKKSMGEAAYIAVAVMAIGNACGRIGAGLLSDQIGRRWTLMLVLLFQAVLMFVAIPVTATKDLAPVVIVLVASLIGFNYGANLSLFPSFTKDLWGLKTFGMNYGVLFTAWGMGGLVLPRLQQMLTANSGSYQSSFITAAVLLIVGAALTLLIRPQPKK
jgi:MFS transporter, OFA family, oxalate/formate antiporter